MRCDSCPCSGTGSSSNGALRNLSGTNAYAATVTLTAPHQPRATSAETLAAMARHFNGRVYMEPEPLAASFGEFDRMPVDARAYGSLNSEAVELLDEAGYR